MSEVPGDTWNSEESSHASGGKWKKFGLTERTAATAWLHGLLSLGAGE